MTQEKIINIPDEGSPLVSDNKKKSIRFFYYKFAAWFYTFALVFHQMNRPALYGQEILLTALNNYLYPLAIYHAISIFLVGAVPYIFLYFMSASKDMYPTLRSKANQPWFAMLLTTSVNVICIPFAIYSVAGPLFYLYHRFYETIYVADLTENLFVISYVIIYAFCYEIWLCYFVSAYNGHLDIFTMCKFVSQQLNRPRGVEV